MDQIEGIALEDHERARRPRSEVPVRGHQQPLEDIGIEGLEGLQDDAGALHLPENRNGPNMDFLLAGELGRLSVLLLSLGRTFTVSVITATVALFTSLVFTLLPQVIHFVAIVLMRASSLLRTGHLHLQAHQNRGEIEPPTPEETDQAEEDRDTATTTTIQCIRCSSERSLESVVRCPSGHATCFGCFSHNVAIQNGHDIVCLHEVRCRLGFEEVELDRLPEGVLWQLSERSQSGFDVPLQGGSEGGWDGLSRRAVLADPAVDRDAVTDVGFDTDVENEQEHTRQRQDSSFRLEQAIFQCTIALGKDRQAETEPRDDHHRDTDNDSDVEDYALSASALVRLREAGPSHRRRASSWRVDSAPKASLRRGETR